MNQNIDGSTGPLQRSVEIGMAVFTAVFALVIIYGSILAGIGWGDEGPQSGFFPFYVGLFILLASAVNFTQAVLINRKDRLFADWGQLRQVLAVVVPTGVYVLLVPFVGIYVASALLIAVFMKWLGRYAWPLTILIAVAVPFCVFVVFELWFLVPLPKGPIENYLGY